MQSRVVKLMASATLTHDPAKIAKLHLHCPRYGRLAYQQLPALVEDTHRMIQGSSVVDTCHAWTQS
jgi:hypothetical protein